MATKWKDIALASKKDHILCNSNGNFYSAKFRYGYLGEPQQNLCVWRSDVGGHFSGNFVTWIPLSSLPE